MNPAGCTLKTLAPAEKAKVVQLMRRIVEQQHQLEALEQERAQEVRAGHYAWGGAAPLLG